MAPLPTGDRQDASGWTDSPVGRGTFTILTSCAFTIIACCWTSVSANLPALGESSWTHFGDKFHVASIGILGPEFLLLLAQGQLSSARRSVKDFRTLDNKGYPEWTLTHAFFADMGGFVLKAPDLDYHIPIDARQLFVLVKNGYIERPKDTKEFIDDKSKADRFARLLTAAQTSWFFMNTIARFAQGLAVTTLELTTLSFVAVNFVSTLCWIHRPSDVRLPIKLETSTSIRHICLAENHDPTLPYQRTPLDFLSLPQSEWIVSRVWKYYTRALERLHIPIMTRPVTTHPWNRIPGDTWLKGDSDLEWVCGIVILLFSASFAVAWNWYFPTRAEQLLWQISSVYVVSFGLLTPPYFRLATYKPLARMYWRSREHSNRYQANATLPAAGHELVVTRSAADRIRNISANKHRDLEVPLRVLLPATVFCGLYCITRMYFLTEDLVGLRSLPPSAYATVDWTRYIPHIASS